MPNQTTALAQRRLLEALSTLEHTTAGGLAGLRVGIPAAVEIAEATGQPALAEVWRRVADLAAAVQDDLRGVSHG